MTKNNISWLENPVVCGKSSRQSGRSQTSKIQNSQEDCYSKLQSDASVNIDNSLNQQGPPPVSEPGYVPAYLASNIGKNVRAEFIINNSSIDKVGRLIEVGINYFVLEDVNSRTNVMCDLYSVKFVTVIV